MAAVGYPASDADPSVCAADDCDVMLFGEGIDVPEAFARGDLERGESAICSSSRVADVELQPSDPVCVDREGVGARRSVRRSTNYWSRRWKESC